ncbi:hypothetical protein [Deinococcus sp.]|uniref:hypothetical protein n=1 Tax=Deinococcus sp. TaxID=47478 RepID=UPI003B5AF13A
MNQMNQAECDQCGTPYVSYQEGLSMGATCPKCGWGYATTNPDAMLAIQRPLPCPQCNSEMSLNIKNNAWIFHCHHCGYAGSIQGLPAIYKDESEYMLKILNFNQKDKAHVSTLAGLLGVNLAAAYKIMGSGETLEFRCDAVKAIKLRKLLTDAAIAHDCVPPLTFSSLDLAPIKDTP